MHQQFIQLVELPIKEVCYKRVHCNAYIQTLYFTLTEQAFAIAALNLAICVAVVRLDPYQRAAAAKEAACQLLCMKHALYSVVQYNLLV